MTPQERLVAYMEAKCELLPEGCRQLIFNEDDRADLLGWKDCDASYTLTQLQKCCSSKWMITDALLCPWCMLHPLKCMSCTFALRHGNCSSSNFNNDYSAALALCAKACERQHAGDVSFAEFVEPHLDRLRAILTE